MNRHLHYKLLERFTENQLKDRLFYGISQLLRDSSRYLYKDTGVTYHGLLAAVEETEGEYGETRTTVKSKSARVEDKASIKQLQEKILTSVVKTSNIVNKTSGFPVKPKFKTPRKDTRILPDSPAKIKAAGVSGLGTTKSGNKPMQC